MGSDATPLCPAAPLPPPPAARLVTPCRVAAPAVAATPHPLHARPPPSPADALLGIRPVHSAAVSPLPPHGTPLRPTAPCCTPPRTPRCLPRPLHRSPPPRRPSPPLTTQAPATGGAAVPLGPVAQRAAPQAPPAAAVVLTKATAPCRPPLPGSPRKAPCHAATGRPGGMGEGAQDPSPRSMLQTALASWCQAEPQPSAALRCGVPCCAVPFCSDESCAVSVALPSCSRARRHLPAPCRAAPRARQSQPGDISPFAAPMPHPLHSSSRPSQDGASSRALPTSPSPSPNPAVGHAPAHPYPPPQRGPLVAGSGNRRRLVRRRPSRS